MSCLLTGAITKDCSFIAGGLTDLWLVNFETITSITDSDTDGVYDAVLPATGVTWYKIAFEENSASYTNELVVSNNQKYVKHGVTFSVGKYDSVMAGNLAELSLGRFMAIARTRTGKMILLGRDNGLKATAVAANSGAADGDFAGAAVTLEGTSMEFAHEVEAAIVTA